MTKGRSRNPRNADCHPDRPHLARGLCAACYVTRRLQARRPDMSDEEKERRRAYFTAYRRVWRAENPERAGAASRLSQQRRADRDPVAHRHRAAAARYGLTVREYRDLIARGVCDACGEPSAKTLEIDHCHDTGRIRGVLCHNCNSALGHVRDDEQRLLGLVAYLRRVSLVA